AESSLGLGETLTHAAATYLATLMAYKDEYEVAPLYTLPEYRQAVEDRARQGAEPSLLTAPPMIAEKNHKGELIEEPFGPWMMPGFKRLKRFRWLRGTRFDVFGMTPERRTERALRDDYIARLDMLASGLTPENHALAVEIASLPDEIRGYGHVKDRSVEIAGKKLAALLARWNAPAPTPAPRKTQMVAAE